MESEAKTEISVCIGTFDPSGIPISVSKHSGDRATVALQTISLNLLVAHFLKIEPAEVAFANHSDGTSIKIEQTLKGFTAYLEDTDSAQ